VETVSIRNLRGERLREEARTGKLLAIANRGALIGVFVPLGPAWLENLVNSNLPRVQRSVDEAERAVAADEPVVTIGDVIGQLQGMLSPGHGDAEPAARSPLKVRIGDLTAKLIEQAGVAGQTLAVSHDRELIAIVVPVTRDPLEFLLDQSMARLRHNTEPAARELADAQPVTLGTLKDGKPVEPVDGKPAKPDAGKPVAPDAPKTARGRKAARGRNAAAEPS
jgi:hypothetical protein